jgi:hypothetical protein
MLQICYIETHLAPLTTLFLSIQNAPGSSPADPLGCLYLSIQIENVFQYNFLPWQEKYISKFLKNSTQLLDRLLLLCVYYSTDAILCLPAP